STDRLPEASGAVRVERKGGTTELEVEVDSMKPASLFGGDYNTYVLWVVPPRGAAENRGEFVLDGSRSSLRTSTGEPSFTLLATDRGLRADRTGMEGSGGGNDETGSRDPRGSRF